MKTFNNRYTILLLLVLLHILYAATDYSHELHYHTTTGWNATNDTTGNTTSSMTTLLFRKRGNNTGHTSVLVTSPDYFTHWLLHRVTSP